MPDQSTEIPRESCLATNFDPDKRPRERVYVGKLESVGGEMWAHALLMPHGAMFAQPVADRIAQTLRALTDIDERGDDGKWTGPVPARFYALLDGSRGCAFCHHPLTDELSMSIGVGPDCAFLIPAKPQ